jgi:hypothetical protein
MQLSDRMRAWVRNTAILANKISPGTKVWDDELCKWRVIKVKTDGN